MVYHNCMTEIALNFLYTFDMCYCLTGGKFLAALGAEGLINEESISVSELDRVYAPLRDQVTDSLHRQDILLSQIQVGGEQYISGVSSVVIFLYL